MSINWERVEILLNGLRKSFSVPANSTSVWWASQLKSPPRYILDDCNLQSVKLEKKKFEHRWEP